MNQAFNHTPIEFVKHVLSLSPVASTGAAQTGLLVDRVGYTGAIALLVYGITGTDTGGTATIQFRSTSDPTGATGWTNFGTPVTAAIPAGTGLGGVIRAGADLAQANRYIDAQFTFAPTGTGETAVIAGIVELAGADRLPAL